MLATRRREILEQVARGEVTPGEAAELLARLDVEAGGGAAGDDAAESVAPPRATTDPGPASGDEAADRLRAAADFAAAHTGRGASADPAAGADRPDPADRPEPAALADQPDGDAAVTAVRLRSTCRAVTVIGDPDVHTAVVDGEHSATVEGDTFVIQAILDHPPGFSFLRTPGGPGLRARVRLGGSEAIRPLVVRMNPGLRFDGEVDAGSMTVRGVRGPIRGHVSAGALRVDDFDGPIELKVAAGAATARGRIDHGASLDILASLGSVDISVEDGR
jgi:hypothetical protein